MSWKLTSDLLLKSGASRSETAAAFERALARTIDLQTDVEGIRFEVFVKGQSTLATVWASDTPWLERPAYAEFFEHLRPGTEGEFTVFVKAGDDLLWPGLEFDGDRDQAILADNSRRQVADATLVVANPRIFLPPNVTCTPSGIPLDADWLRRFYSAVVEELPVRTMYGLSGAEVSFAPAYLSVFHEDVRGFLADLTDVLRISLRGGSGYYPDARRRYPSLLESDESLPWYFGAGGSRSRVQEVRELLASAGRKLESHPDRINTATEVDVRAAIAATPSVRALETHGGLLLCGEPFLERNVGDFYWNLIRRLAGDV